MPSNLAARTKSYHHHRKKKVLAGTESDPEKLVVLPSASDVLVEEGAQVSSSSLETIPSAQRHHHHHRHPSAVRSFGIIPGLPLAVDKRSSAVQKKPRSCLPKITEVRPEELRNAFLNQGTTYWTIVTHASTLLAAVSFAQFVLYFVVFGMTGSYRIMIALLPVRDEIMAWFICLVAGDLLVMVIIRLGKWMSKGFGIAKKIDTYILIVSTAILCVTLIASMLFPVYATPNLIASVTGTIQQNSTICLEPRNNFMEAGTDWASIPKLQAICKKHVLCIDACRDFRSLYIWVYGTYLVSVVRLFVLLTFWNTVSFLGMILNLREEFIEFQLNFDRV